MQATNADKTPRLYLLKGLLPDSRGTVVYFGFPPNQDDKFFQHFINNYESFEIESCVKNEETGFYTVKCVGYDFVFLNLFLCGQKN